MMRPITFQDVIAHQAVVPWPNLLQVEQDLVLCHCMRAIFADDFLRAHVAMRGGTVLHKVHLAPAARYSEDIDLVLLSRRPEGDIDKALRRVLQPILGEPGESIVDKVRLAVRNAARPSRILRSTYLVAPVTPSPNPIRIVVETNVNERASHLPPTEHGFAFQYGGVEHACSIRSFDIHEMLGTKMRALFQRERGRDLFDLFHALSLHPSIEPAKIVECFLFYMKAEGTKAEQAEFVELLGERVRKPGFRSDMAPLLRTGLAYDVDAAAIHVRDSLLRLLP
jgi:predicted nucleotidyltransferase component of viral defense system